MKKSGRKFNKIAAACGVAIFSLAASIAGTYAWFMAERQYSASTGDFSVVAITGNAVIEDVQLLKFDYSSSIIGSDKIVDYLSPAKGGVHLYDYNEEYGGFGYTGKYYQWLNGQWNITYVEPDNGGNKIDDVLSATELDGLSPSNKDYYYVSNCMYYKWYEEGSKWTISSSVPSGTSEGTISYDDFVLLDEDDVEDGHYYLVTDVWDQVDAMNTFDPVERIIHGNGLIEMNCNAIYKVTINSDTLNSAYLQLKVEPQIRSKLANQIYLSSCVDFDVFYENDLSLVSNELLANNSYYPNYAFDSSSEEELTYYKLSYLSHLRSLDSKQLAKECFKVNFLALSDLVNIGLINENVLLSLGYYNEVTLLDLGYFDEDKLIELGFLTSGDVSGLNEEQVADLVETTVSGLSEANKTILINSVLDDLTSGQKSSLVSSVIGGLDADSRQALIESVIDNSAITDIAKLYYSKTSFLDSSTLEDLGVSIASDIDDLTSSQLSTLLASSKIEKLVPKGHKDFYSTPVSYVNLAANRPVTFVDNSLTVYINVNYAPNQLDAYSDEIYNEDIIAVYDFYFKFSFTSEVVA